MGDVVIQQSSTVTAVICELVQGPQGVPGTGGGVVGNGSWSTPNWYVDPQNVSGHASDTNNGTTSSTPFLHYYAILTQWQTYSPILSQNTTITFLSSHTDDSDPVICKPYLANGATLFFTGTTTVLASGTLSTVTAKNRATPQLWQAGLGTAVAPLLLESLFIDTTTGACAWPYTQVSADVCTLSQPMAATSLAGYGTPNAQLDTLANGNAFQILGMTSINFAELDCKMVEFAPSYLNGIQVTRVHCYDPRGVSADDLYVGNYVGFVECAIDREIVPLYTNTDANAFAHNCALNGGMITPPGMVILGGVATEGVVASGYNSITYGPLVDGNTILAGGCIAKDIFNVGSVYIAASSTIEAAELIQVSGLYVSSTWAMWGPGEVVVSKRGALLYGGATSATAYFLLTGPIEINGVTSAFAVSSNGDWLGGIAITPANLDAAITAGGFGGAAINPSGGVISTAEI